jgi:hypothetical protein
MRDGVSPPNFIPLEAIEIASPCHADWNKMRGDGRSRHCSSCNKSVYNIAGMTRAEAEQLLKESDGNLCLRLYQRADGTVLTSDCPIGAVSVERSANWVSNLMLAAVAAILGFIGVKMVTVGLGHRVTTGTFTAAPGSIATLVGDPLWPQSKD